MIVYNRKSNKNNCKSGGGVLGQVWRRGLDSEKRDALQIPADPGCLDGLFPAHIAGTRASRLQAALPWYTCKMYYCNAQFY